jgi:hypothetical protein
MVGVGKEFWLGIDTCRDVMQAEGERILFKRPI